MEICKKCHKTRVHRSHYCRRCWSRISNNWYWENREKILKERRRLYKKYKSYPPKPVEPKTVYTNTNPSEGTIKWIKFEGYYNLVNQLMADVNLAHIAFETNVPPEIIRSILRG